MRKPTLAAAMTLALFTPGACGPDSLPRPERVIVVVLDATHAAHLGCYGGPEGLTPRIDTLATRGVRFSHALSNTTWTLPSTVSLMTGLVQERHGVITNRHRVGEEHVLLAELFTRAGWQTAAFVQMVYASSAFGLERGFAHHRDYGLTGGPHPDTMIPEVLAWMDAHASERYLLYLHLRRPHSPYNPNALARLRVEGDCALADGRRDGVLAHADSQVHEPLDEPALAHVEHLYRGNLATVDDHLTEILERAARDDNTLVVLTSDHGEALGRQGRYGHGSHLLPETIDIPLIVAGPGLEPRVVDAPACTVDLLPTLLEACRIPLPADVALDGRSLVPELRGSNGPAPKRVLAISARYAPTSAGESPPPPEHGAVQERFRLVLDSAGTWHLYDRGAPSAEDEDISTRYPEVAARLLQAAQALRAVGAVLARVESDADTPTSLPPEVREELEALGYLR